MHGAAEEEEKDTEAGGDDCTRILPTVEEVGQTWTWSDEDMAMLAGSGLVDSTASLRDKIAREYEMITTELVVLNGLSAPPVSRPLRNAA